MTRRHIGRARALLSVLALGLFLLAVSWGSGTLDLVIPNQTPGVAAHLIAVHHCWTGPAPHDMLGKLPGHVVATYAPSRGPSRTVYSSSLVGPALDQLFGGKPYGIEVHAFCR